MHSSQILWAAAQAEIKERELIIVPVKVHGTIPNCLSRSCHFSRECANHTTAGDFRTEDGLIPDLKQLSSGKWGCSQHPTDNHGAIKTDGSLYDFGT